MTGGSDSQSRPYGGGTARSLRCKLGRHRHTDVKIHCDDERLKFGLPYCYFTWTCSRCGKKGTT